MTVAEVLARLDAERDKRGMSNWEKRGSSTAALKSYGIGLTRLRELAKRIGRDRELAQALWKTDPHARPTFAAPDTWSRVCGRVARAYHGESGIPARWLELPARASPIRGLADDLRTLHWREAS